MRRLKVRMNPGRSVRTLRLSEFYAPLNQAALRGVLVLQIANRRESGGDISKLFDGLPSQGAPCPSDPAATTCSTKIRHNTNKNDVSRSDYAQKKPHPSGTFESTRN